MAAEYLFYKEMFETPLSGEDRFANWELSDALAADLDSGHIWPTPDDGDMHLVTPTASADDLPLPLILEQARVDPAEALQQPLPEAQQTGKPLQLKLLSKSVRRARRPQASFPSPPVHDSARTCPVCRKAIRNQYARHVRTHSPEHTFRCPAAGCLKSYSRCYDLEDHLRETHLGNILTVGEQQSAAITAVLQPKRGSSSLTVENIYVPNDPRRD